MRNGLVPSLLLFTLATACNVRSENQIRQQGSAQQYDIVITNGKIVDGTGNPWFYGDVGISGDHITRVTPAGMLHDATAKEKIDARGLVVAPGVIDIQAQSYPELLSGDSRVVSMITQGVTTMILGEGDTPAPANENLFKSSAAIAIDTSLQREMRGFTGPRGFDAWLRAMEKHTASVNFGSFVGAGTVRGYA
jgi:dihydroorotase/N-acyl-D-amino-acid deacylase